MRSSHIGVLVALAVFAAAIGAEAGAHDSTRQLQAFGRAFGRFGASEAAEPEHTLDANGNYVADIEVSEEHALGVPMLASTEYSGALQKETARAENEGGKCRRFDGHAIPMFDHPEGSVEVASSVIIPEKGTLLSVSVLANLTHAKAGSAGLSLYYGDQPTDRPHIVLKSPCDPESDACDHDGENMEAVLFSDEAEATFPQDEFNAPFTGEYLPYQPLKAATSCGAETAGNGGTFGRWTLIAKIPGEPDAAPDMDWQLQVCYVPTEPAVEGVMDSMEDIDGSPASNGLVEQEAGAMASSFVRRMIGGANLPAPQRAFFGYMGRMFVQYATCYGLYEAYQRMHTLYCNTFGGPIFLGIQFVTDPTCPTDIPPLSAWLTPFLELIGSY